MKNDVCVELYYGGAWHDIEDADRVYTRDTISIGPRGRPDRATRVVPTVATLTINNRDGQFSARNPLSPLYGLIGRNTPIRISVRMVGDLFDRTVAAGGWGSTTYGIAWSLSSGSAADFSVSGSAGLQSHGSVALLRGQSVPAWSVNQDVVATGSVPVASPSGASISQWVCGRYTDSGNYYAANLSVTTAGIEQLSLLKRVATVLSSLGAGVTLGTGHAANEQWSIRLQVKGTTVRARAWLASTDEPTTWTHSVTDASLTSGTSAALLSRLESGYLGGTPAVISWQAFEVRRIRFVGEVESWPQRWTMDGADAWVPIRATGILGRLNASGTNAPVLSPLRRSIESSATQPFAYWSMETDHTGDTALSDTLPSPIAGCGDLVQVVAGASFGKGFAGASAVKVPDFRTGGELAATLADDGLFNGTTGYTIEFVSRFDNNASSLSGLTAIWETPGAEPSNWNMAAGPDMFLVFGSATTGQGNASAGGTEYDGIAHHYRVTVQQSGGNIIIRMYRDGVLVDTGDDFGGGDPLVTGTVQRPVLVHVNSGNLGEPATDQATGIGHLTFWHGVSPPVDTVAAAGGYIGETDVERITRLCAEASIPLEVIGESTVTLGAQQYASLVDLLTQAADAGLGILAEARDTLGLVYVTHAAQLNRTATLALNYVNDRAIADGLAPVEDTHGATNDVTVERIGGATVRVTRDTGPLGTAEPPTGIGRIPKRYPVNLEADAQLQQHAGWLLHLGTWDEPRYPVLPLDLGAMLLTGNKALAADAADLEVGYLISIASPPIWAGPETLTMHAQGFTEEIGQKTWRLLVNAAPAKPYAVSVYGTGRYDAGATATAEVVDIGETAIDVLSTDSTRWSTAAPYDIMIGGERMTVTSCTSPSSASQTMTVTRTLAKQHLAGASVRVADPARYAR